ncbi:hypothetical protein NL449_27825, partial [Klebsiella pneumoniae]|nr:hypothetical protein [Klebsiella pneumoniae]
KNHKRLNKLNDKKNSNQINKKVNNNNKISEGSKGDVYEFDEEDSATNPKPLISKRNKISEYELKSLDSKVNYDKKSDANNKRSLRSSL